MTSPQTSDSWIGRLVGDRERYRLEKCLGVGGMGEVFLATDTILSQQVALKLIKDTLVSSGELRERFEREVTVCAALKSKHIVEVNDYGVTAEGYPFYVMEYLSGKTLGQLLRQQKRLSVERTVGIVSQVCEGLRLAHEGVTLWRDGAAIGGKIKVIHRDLKPDNIFLVSTSQGEVVKVLDFGIAKIRDDSNQQTNLTRTFIGTFHYASPEQLGISPDLDGRSDIYSLGVILYEMLSGTDPFGLGVGVGNTTGVAWARAHASKPPLLLRSQPGLEHLSPALEAVVMRCLQKVPKERFASVDELNQALQSAAMSEMSQSHIPQTLLSFGQGSDDRTVNRPILIPELGAPDSTIYQSPDALHSAEDDTVNRPLAEMELGVPDSTIYQSPPVASDLDSSTINRKLEAEQAPDLTIAQIPEQPAPFKSEQTIAQIPKQPAPFKSDLTITQIPQQTPPDSTSQKHQHSSPNPLIKLLLPLGIGFAIGLAVMGGIYVYFQLQPSETSQPQTK